MVLGTNDNLLEAIDLTYIILGKQFMFVYHISSFPFLQTFIWKYHASGAVGHFILTKLKCHPELDMTAYKIQFFGLVHKLHNVINTATLIA
jgi:hypothetical protein